MMKNCPVCGKAKCVCNKKVEKLISNNGASISKTKTTKAKNKVAKEQTPPVPRQAKMPEVKLAKCSRCGGEARDMGMHKCKVN